MKIKYFVLVLLLFIFTNRSFSQSTKVKIDSIRMQVLFIACPSFIPTKGVVYTDNPTHYFITPLKNKNSILNLEKESTYLDIVNHNSNNATGVFIYDSDGVMVNMGTIKKTRLNVSDFLDKLPPLGVLDDNVKELPGKYNGKYRYYSAYTLDALWLKYTIYDPSKAKASWKSQYSKQVKKSSGKSYNYYLLAKIYSKNKVN